MFLMKSAGARGRLLGSVIPGKSLPVSGLSFPPTKWNGEGKGMGLKFIRPLLALMCSDLLCVRIEIGGGGGRSFWKSFRDFREEKRMDRSYSRTKDWVAHWDLF